jgi:hypothetical protein
MAKTRVPRGLRGSIAFLLFAGALYIPSQALATKVETCVCWADCLFGSCTCRAHGGTWVKCECTCNWGLPECNCTGDP